MIQERVNAITRLATSEFTDGKTIAVAVESNQIYLEYLDSLLDADIIFDTSVTVKVDGVTIKFNSVEEMAAWITSNKQSK